MTEMKEAQLLKTSYKWEQLAGRDPSEGQDRRAELLTKRVGSHEREIRLGSITAPTTTERKQEREMVRIRSPQGEKKRKKYRSTITWKRRAPDLACSGNLEDWRRGVGPQDEGKPSEGRANEQEQWYFAGERKQKKYSKDDA